MMIKATNPMTLAIIMAVWHPTLRKARKSSTAHDWTAESEKTTCSFDFSDSQQELIQQ